MDQITVPASIATLLAIDPMQLQAMSGLASTLAPESIASDLEQIDPPRSQA
jgi:hypothetical protein